MPPMIIKTTATMPLAAMMFFTILAMDTGSVLSFGTTSHPNDCRNSGSIDVSQISLGLVTFPAAKD